MNFAVKEMSYKFDSLEKKTLDNVSFSIQEGEIASIVGKSGCGKSTLANILSGVIPELIKNGEVTGTFDMGENQMIGVVSQSPENQLFGYSVEDAIVFGVENLGKAADEIGDSLEYVLDLLNIQHLRSRSIATLSGGQRQAVCIASVLAMQPDILIMDEPVSSLDPSGKLMISKILTQLKASGQTTIIIDNNLDWCSYIVEHIIGLEDGKVVFDGAKEEFFRDFDIQNRLGVYIPQEVLIYRALKQYYPDTDMFYTLDGAIEEIEKQTGLKRNDRASVTREMPAFEPAVKVEDLTKTFSDNFHALIDINVSFPKGAITTILGQNGSGKTTLVKHLNGLYRATAGRVLYLDQDLISKTVAEISRDIILVFQHPEHMLFEETVYKELIFCAEAQKVNYTQEDVEQVLTQFEFQKEREEFPVNLPMGKKHILTILSVLFSSADVIILDEPTLGLDNYLKEKLKEIIGVLRQKGKTVIIISHEIPLVFEVSDYIYLLNNGKSMFFGDKEDMIEHYEMLEDVKILVPPVIKLAKYFGLPADIVTADAFAKALKNKAGGEQ